MGPGTYNTPKDKVNYQAIIQKARPECGITPREGGVSIAEQALIDKPAFSAITAARPDDIRKWQNGFVSWNPSPDHYAEGHVGMGDKFVDLN